ncbi:hypothetical protein CLV57_1623 [Mucilaginibacter auburnensis]|uniref:Uncharacterized protein n=1 Tax=Mucilaginibacter auburnensis TaxID=1457233 RepID=A0A2H9VUY8_9SPHI|nr:hypothetical protein CLV57_1623 [Mucilaginibacter auburnensis]
MGKMKIQLVILSDSEESYKPCCAVRLVSKAYKILRSAQDDSYSDNI